jgi:hypothetical protein
MADALALKSDGMPKIALTQWHYGARAVIVQEL